MTLYISSLSPKISEAALKELFLKVGSVASIKLVRDRNTGGSRGFAYIEMPIESEAQAAIEQLNNTEMGGKLISIKEARPREEKPRTFSPKDKPGNRRF